MSRPKLAVPLGKLTDYLLDLNHKEGASKAKFFLSHGFTRASPATLAIALLDHGEAGWPGTVIQTPFGDKHRVHGPLALADGTYRNFRSVWELKTGSTTATLVTAIPQ